MQLLIKTQFDPIHDKHTFTFQMGIYVKQMLICAHGFVPLPHPPQLKNQFLGPEV